MITYTTQERITAYSAEKLTSDLIEFCNKKCNEEIIVDMQHTVYLSSAALRALLIANKSAKAKGIKPFKIINASEHVKNIFKITGFDELLIIE